MANQAQIALTILWLWIVSVRQSTGYCPPCPAEPPCTCVIAGRYEEEQVLSCPQTEFPKLADVPAVNKTADQYCLLRIAHSNFTEIPANSLASLNRRQVTFDANPHLSAIRAFAFNGTTIARLYLWLGSNITVIEQHAFSGGDTLRILAIKGIRMLETINGTTLPDEIFAGLKGLTKVHLDDLNLVTIPTSLIKLRNIEFLSLTGNQLTAEDLDRRMPAWQRLEYIDLTENNLENIPRFLQKLKLIKHVWITYSDEKQTRLVCGRQLCWLTEWDALYQNPDNGSAAVELHATCKPKECLHRPFTSHIRADVRDFVILGGLCNVSAATNDSFRQNHDNAFASQLHIEIIATNVNTYCSAMTSGVSGAVLSWALISCIIIICKAVF